MFAVRVRGRLLYLLLHTGRQQVRLGFFILRLFYGAASAEEFIEFFKITNTMSLVDYPLFSWVVVIHSLHVSSFLEARRRTGGLQQILYTRKLTVQEE